MPSFIIPFYFLIFFLSFFILYVGKETVHQIYGTRVAVLAGDFMFAQSSWYLANLENLEVIKLISQVYNLISISTLENIKKQKGKKLKS